MPANHKRKLVDIDADIYSEFKALQRECKRAGSMIPTIPYLVNRALKEGKKQVIEALWPKLN